jgi:hypothetical protein
MELPGQGQNRAQFTNTGANLWLAGINNGKHDNDNDDYDDDEYDLLIF